MGTKSDDPHDHSGQGPGCMKRCSNVLVLALESFFYRLGKLVSGHPWLTILLTLLLGGSLSAGMVKFYEERREEKLWTPYGSRVIEHQNWINENFPAQFRFQNLLIEADNVLQPSVLRAMLALDSAVKNVSTDAANWTSICYRIGHQCWSSSLLELWSFNENVINSLSQQDILDKINTNNLISPLTFRPYDVEAVLGEIHRDSDGKISGAKATTMLYAVKDQTIERQGERIDEIRLDWEKKFLDVALEERSDVVTVTPYSSEQSWIDEAQGPIQKNLNLLAAGFVILFGYATMSLGQFNCIGQKMYVSLAGMVCVGLAVVGAMGVCSAAGAAYGPVHTILPFLILGIGVDDMFVIVTAWNNLSQEERKLDRRQQAALALKHAGVSITVTSMTDVVAFGVGASTVLPALQSFCIYAAVSVFLAFVYSCTLFFAVVCLDFQRWEGSRNAYCCCYKHAEDYRPTECSQKDHLQLFFQKIYAPGLLTTPGKPLAAKGE
ncbi:patched domain-containing protein 3-like [Branchiostoma floridae]|uniref:Patched domain-containing protein 3-like n=1 Tax=Branchiostoma floridae TaxID=7739 RepID=A0A9J7M9L1_BRAFL|nr:patched domain-containing protein 3-like [Branchiostoma floridae]